MRDELLLRPRLPPPPALMLPGEVLPTARVYLSNSYFKLQN